jgi:hypothetical protein
MEYAREHDFEDAEKNAQWRFVQSGQTNYWTIGSAAGSANGGNNALYVTNNGSDYVYTASDAYSISWAYLPVTLSALDSIAFDWKGIAEGSYDNLQVFLFPKGYTPKAGDGNLPNRAIISLGDYICGQEEWQRIGFFPAVEGEYNLCLSDFVSPHGDRIGLFAASVESGFGKEYADDDYKRLIAQTLADRLAEATATLLHKQVRTNEELWGYSPHEQLTTEELLAERNRGIRPAVGYPSLPDQSIIFTIDKLLGLKEAGIALTPNGAMTPHASVCGLMIHHPAARYFAVGKIDDVQLHDYARRRGVEPEAIIKFLAKNIG